MQTITNFALNTQPTADVRNDENVEIRHIEQLPTPMLDFVGGGGAIINTN